MDDQDRVEELGKEFNAEKRPSQSSEEISWTFLDGRKSAENSPKPPKIAVNSQFLSPDEGEPEMSDGISVISEGEGHGTPPESDTAAATPDAVDNNTDPPGATGSAKVRFNFDAVRQTRKGYRPLTPPQTPPTEGGEADNEEETTTGELATIQDALVVKKKKQGTLDLESFPEANTQARRFVGIYPRHVVFLMIVCGIIGGMVGHLWNVNYGCNCPDANQKLNAMYSKAASENLILHEQLLSCQNRPTKGPKAEERKLVTPKTPPLSGHEDNDDMVSVHEEATKHRFIPEDEFESLIWEHLRKTDEQKKGQAPDIFPEMQSQQSEHDNQDRNEKFKRSVGQDEGKRHRDDDSEEDDSHERNGKWKAKKEFKQGSEQKYQKYKSGSSKEAKYDTKQKQGKYEKRNGGSGDGAKRYDRSKEDSREKKTREYDRKYDKKYPENNNYRKKERGSGEWSDKRNRGRDEMRQQKREGEKNWYLERASEREINRAEAGVPPTAY